MSRLFLSIILSLIVITNNAQQIEINRINQMPDFPQPYLMRNWNQVALGYDSLVFDITASGEYFPLTSIYASGINYPSNPYFGIQSYVGHSGSGLEAINVLPAVVGASLCGIDKTTQHNFNWVLACEEFFNKTNNQLVYLNSPLTSSGNDWWYDVMPNVFFYQLNDLYPHTGDFEYQFTSVADRWLSAVYSLGGSTTPWTIPYMNYRAFDLITGLPLQTGVPEPEAAGAIAWIMYNAYTQTHDKKYLVGAELCLEFLDTWDSNPSYELQLPYGIYTAARMNAEIGTNYDIEKMMNWAFEVGELRQWGAIIGTWNGIDVSGLIGEARSDFRDYAFNMNGMEQMGALVPMLKYDDRYANAIGKWCLNIANASRLFYGKYLPEENQSNAEWNQAYDPNSYIGYEALKEIENNISPMATGDAMAAGWANTNLALYGSSHVGIFGAIVDTTNIEGILKLNMNATNYYANNTYPSFLLYNPFSESHSIMLTNSNQPLKIYDGVSNKVIVDSGSEEIYISIPPKSSVLAYLLPADGNITQNGNNTLCNGIIIDYNNGNIVNNSAPRIKALETTNQKIITNTNATIYCSAEDIDNDSLNYYWNINGQATNAGEKLSYVFNNVGFYTISCTVVDSDNLSNTDTLIVEVVDKIEEPPVIQSMKSDPPKINIGAQTALFCQAIDPNSDDLTYIWSAVMGYVEGNTPNANFIAPDEKGIYYVKCTVIDIDSLFISDSIAIIVDDSSTQVTGKLIASYRFSNSVYDYSGNEHNGIAYNCTYVDDFHGNIEQAISLDYGNSYVKIPNDESLNFTDGLTISLLASPTKIDNHEMFIISHGSWEQRWKMSLLDNGLLRFTINSTEGICDVDSKTEFLKDEYYHITGVYNGSTMELYINGTLENFKIFSGEINPSTYDIVMGRNIPGNGNYNFSGILDDVSIFNYGLSYVDVQTNYNNDISEIEDNNNSGVNLYIFPNPASNKLFIEVPNLNNNNISVKLFSLEGTEVFTRTTHNDNNQIILSLEGIKSGLYIVQITMGKKSQSEKIIIR